MRITLLVSVLILSGLYVQSVSAQEIPPWIKNSAGWWAKDQISDSDFVNGIQYLIIQQIISVSNYNQEIKESEIQKIGTFDISKSGPVEGDKDALFSIIMFSDYQCEKCSLWFKHEKSLLTKDIINPGKAKFYHLDFPFLGEDSF